jgi:four helix bundle protein
MEWFVSLPVAKDLPTKMFTQIDEAATSIVLNTAEGNGRYGELDQLHFIEIAQKSAVRTMVYLDLCVARGLISVPSVSQGKEALGQVSAMLGGF